MNLMFKSNCYLNKYCHIPQECYITIDRDKNLIIQFPVFIQPYTQQLLIIYQIETVPVPFID